jgi:hypothetical protein
MPFTRRATRLSAVTLIVGVLALAGCVPEPAPGESASPVPTATAGASATPVESDAPAPPPSAAPAALPGDCLGVYSPQMLSTLESEIPPLNDPGITLLSTQQAPLLELLETVPTLRCTWGPPSEVGISTNVSAVDEAGAATVLDALVAAGFGCEASGEATVCRIEQRGITLDDVEFRRGETHAVRGGLWIATAWVNVSPDGYTEDILATLVG